MRPLSHTTVALFAHAARPHTTTIHCHTPVTIQRYRRRVRPTLAALAIVLASSIPARADALLTDAGELSGRVVDAQRKPVAGASVHVVSATGATQVLVTNRDGRFGPTSSTGTVLVYVDGDLTITGGTATSNQQRRSELIEIYEVIPPALPAEPLSDTLLTDYTEGAIEHDVWARAWLLLDVDAKGTVRRLKLLDRPGYGLDAIAITEAFKLRFNPARDAADRPTSSLVVWYFEWPSYSWLKGDRSRSVPPCPGGGPSSIYRNCGTPTLANVLTKPWLPGKRPSR